MKEIKLAKLNSDHSRLANLIKKANRLPNLGLSKYNNPDEDLKLTDELQPTLRQLVPEGSILKDRYHHFLKRGLIEPHTHKKGKYKKKFKQKYRVKRAIKNLLEIESINELK